MTKGFPQDFNPEEFIDPKKWPRSTYKEKHNVSLAILVSINNHLFGSNGKTGFLPFMKFAIAETSQRLPNYNKRDLEPTLARMELMGPKLYQKLTYLGLSLKSGILLIESERKERKDKVHYHTSELMNPHVSREDYDQMKTKSRDLIDYTKESVRVALIEREEEVLQVATSLDFRYAAGVFSIAEKFEESAAAMIYRFNELRKSIKPNTFL